jgi:hypothetical protein
MYKYLQTICAIACQLSTVHVGTHSAKSKQRDAQPEHELPPNSSRTSASGVCFNIAFELSLSCLIGFVAPNLASEFDRPA